MNQLTRRHLMLGALFGGGYVGLRSMVSGIPIDALRQGLVPSAHAAEVAGTGPQFLILSTDGSGDPFNANVPGVLRRGGRLYEQTRHHGACEDLAWGPAI